MIQKEAQNMMVDACVTVIENLSKENGISKEQLRIRIDLEELKAKPLFSIFCGSEFRATSSLRGIIISGGGRGLAMFLSVQIRGIVRDIFNATLLRCQESDTKTVFVLLYLKENAPTIAIYHRGQFLESLSIAEILSESGKQIE